MRFKASVSSSLWMSLLPVSFTLLTEGRSSTSTMRASPTRCRCTSEKKPVLNSARTASAAVFIAREFHLIDGGTLLHHDDEGIAHALQVHVGKKASLEQCAHRLRCARLVQGIADVDRQIIEYRAHLDSLQALHSDVLNVKGVEGVGRRQRGAQHEHGRKQKMSHSYPHRP